MSSELQSDHSYSNCVLRFDGVRSWVKKGRYRDGITARDKDVVNALAAVVSDRRSQLGHHNPAARGSESRSLRMMQTGHDLIADGVLLERGWRWEGDKHRSASE